MERAILRAAVAGWIGLLLAASGAATASMPVPEGAHAVGAFDGEDPRVEARLLVDRGEPDSELSLRIGVLFDLDPGWHLYWRNPGETGLPTVVRWSADGAEVGPTAWPAPSVFGPADGLFTSYGYSDQVLLAAEAVLGEPESPSRMVRADVELLVCEVECIPARFSLSRSLDADEGGAAAERESIRRLFETHAARVPVAPDVLDVRLEGILSQSAIRPGDRFRGAIAVRPCVGTRGGECEPLGPVPGKGAFFADAIESIDLEVTGIEPHPGAPDAFVLTFQGSAGPEDPGQDQRLSGVLALRGSGGGLRHVAVDLPLPRARAGDEVVSLGEDWLVAASPRSEGRGLSLLHALMLAFLGGLVLNLMPCVLPVLAIKVVAIADLARRSRREVLAHGAAYTLGILCTMSALAAAVMLLRAAGTSVGWGFQFQEPLFVAAISVVLVVFALNLFGVFEIQFQGGGLSRLGQEETGPRRSFFEGLLAVVLATPCTAPFLGTAVGFAFAGSGAEILGIFAVIGVGLAMPFALVSLVPAWARWIPRSGAWMLKVRTGLGFALLASVVWLLWIVGRALGPDDLIALLGALLGVAFAAWLYGLAQRGGARPLRLATGVGVVLLACTGLNVVRSQPQAASAWDPVERSSAWQIFEPAAVARELESGRRVFVYFTADWCLTCKVNERRVIRDADVQAELERMDVAVFRADWTRRDEAIRVELARFGRAGVPLYLVYHPSTPERPTLLPELLTARALLGALEAPESLGAPLPVQSGRSLLTGAQSS